MILQPEVRFVRRRPGTHRAVIASIIALVGILAWGASTVVASDRLQPPDWRQPVAGNCLGPQVGEIATFVLGVDVPRPRCGKVMPAQRLRLVDATSSTINVVFNRKTYSLAPDDATTFPDQFGEIWQPGIHLLRTISDGRRRNGPEIWLVSGLSDSAMKPPAGSMTNVGWVLLATGLLLAAVRFRQPTDAGCSRARRRWASLRWRRCARCSRTSRAW
jgi:hypothetical protein